MAWSPGPSRYPEVEQNYELFETLGSGGFAKVKLGVHKLTGEKVAVKIMNKKQLGDDLHRVYREIRALKKLHHQHICQMFEIIETEKMIYVILEYCSGGELFDYIVAKERLKENEARAFFRQIVSALMYIHSSGFIHRDLKPENLLLDEDSNIKVIDFGLVSEPTSTNELLKTCCGSPAYAAPELITGGPYIGPRADVWSLGVLLYALLNGFLPFDDDNTAVLYSMIKKGEYEEPCWLSRGSISIIADLLQTIPNRRVAVEDLLSHEWAMKGYSRTINWQSQIELRLLDDDCISELAYYHGMSEANMRGLVKEWNYDNITATYFLLLQQKNSGKKPKIRVPPRRHMRQLSGGESYPMSPTNTCISPLLVSSRNGSTDDTIQMLPIDKDETVGLIPEFFPAPKVPERRSRKISLGQPMHPPTFGEIVSLQKQLSPVPARPMHPAIMNVLSQSPEVPISRPKDTLLPPPLTPPTGGNISASPSFNYEGRQSQTLPAPSILKTISFDSRLNKIADNPPDNLPSQLISSPGSRRRFGSVDLVLNKMKKVFKRPVSANEAGPRKVKGLFDVSTTSRLTETEVMNEIERVLEHLDVEYTKPNNYTYRCRKNAMERRGAKKQVEFSFEICLIANLDMIGIKRKRIHGDIWHYKQLCEEILSSTHL